MYDLQKQQEYDLMSSVIKAQLPRPLKFVELDA